ncbi:MAG: DUF6089 family protein [Bacteroidota bacterium]
MIRKLLVLFTISCSPIIGLAQYNWDIGFHAGASNYLGEMGGKSGTRRNFVSDMKISKTQFALGGFARYKFGPLISAKVGLNWIRIGGADNASTNPGRVGRNLSFRNDLIELELTGQVFFLEIPDLGHTYRYRNDFKMYAFGGVAGFYHSPKAHYMGKWVALRPLKTEGISYKSVVVSIPLGIGLFFTLEKRHRIGWEFNWRTTFTDYLDDVSSFYPDPATLSSAEAVALSNRRGELEDREGVPHETNYGWNAEKNTGNKRGDPSHKDSYITTSVYYSYVIRGKSSFYRSKYGSIFKKKKYKKRKIRAKF